MKKSGTPENDFVAHGHLRGEERAERRRSDDAERVAPSGGGGQQPRQAGVVVSVHVRDPDQSERRHYLRTSVAESWWGWLGLNILACLSTPAKLCSGTLRPPADRSAGAGHRSCPRLRRAVQRSHRPVAEGQRSSAAATVPRSPSRERPAQTLAAPARRHLAHLGHSCIVLRL